MTAQQKVHLLGGETILCVLHGYAEDPTKHVELPLLFVG